MRREGFGALLAMLTLFLFASPHSAAFQKTTDAGLRPDFDLRSRVEPSVRDAERARVTARFSERFGEGLRLHWGDLSERPLLVHRPGSVIAAAQGGDPVEAARAFLKGASPAFGLGAAEVDDLDAAKVYTTAGLGVTHVQFVQRVGDVSVFRGQVRVNLDRHGGVLNVGGEYFPGLAAPEAPALTAADALRTAAEGLGLSGEVPDVLERESDGDRRTVFAARGDYLAPPEARLVLLPEGPGRARLVWEVTVHEAVTGWDNLYRVLVDAASGGAVLRELLTLYAGPTTPADATGEVFDCKDPETCAQTIMSFAGDPTASPSNWVADGQTESQGNNIASRADWGGGNMDGSNPLADGGRKLEFHFPFQNAYEQNGDWGTDSEAAITNAFYWGNLIHDHWYALGFDEAAGNYQDDNFGNGGLGNDHVNVDVQDAASRDFIRNNANWSPSLDGSPPRTNYFLWTTPDRDGAFAAKVIWHEFGHGLSTRLVGGPSTQCLGGAQGGGMGEGWGDWVAVNYFGGPGEDPAGPAVIGEYVTGDQQNGIRRYPYHHDLAIDPLTYADLCDGGSCAVHDEGEIWASVLWDMRHDLVLELGLDEAKLRSEQLVIDAMKLSPCSPNFVTMRDSIVQADEQRYAGAHVCLIRAAFARRGLGAGASSNGSGADATPDFQNVLPMDASAAFAADKTMLNWAGRSDAIAYRVARGDFGSNAEANTFDNATCLGETTATEFQDNATPAAGAGFYYVIALEDDCFRSSYGSDTAGTLRSVNDCP